MLLVFSPTVRAGAVTHTHIYIYMTFSTFITKCDYFPLVDSSGWFYFPGDLPHIYKKWNIHLKKTKHCLLKQNVNWIVWLHSAHRRKSHLRTTYTSPSSRYASHSSLLSCIQSNIIGYSHVISFASEKCFEPLHIQKEGLEKNKYWGRDRQTSSAVVQPGTWPNFAAST
jgi:hypothetical protein